MPKCGRVYQKANHHLPFFDRDGIMKVSAKHENKESVPYRTRMFLQNYIQCTTPMLLDEYGDSDLLRMMQKHDILKQRSEELDTDAARFHSLENIEETFSDTTKETPYSNIQQIANVSVLGSSKPELKKITYRFISRLRSMKEPSLTEEAQGRYHKYISYLYAQNSGEIQELEELYDAVECAVMNWNGQFGSEKICIDDTNEHFWILETLKLEFAPPQSSHSNTKKEITRFAPVLSVYLKKDGGSDSETARINLDYTLFEMICSIQEGYRPTVQDKNLHCAPFQRFGAGSCLQNERDDGRLPGQTPQCAADRRLLPDLDDCTQPQRQHYKRHLRPLFRWNAVSCCYADLPDREGHQKLAAFGRGRTSSGGRTQTQENRPVLRPDRY